VATQYVPSRAGAEPVAERRIVLWRHGRTAWNAERRFQGQIDVPLDEVGLLQADRAADLLTGLRPDVLLSSDLQRATATAAALAERTGLPVRSDAGLRETLAGQWQGLDESTLRQRYGADLARWAAGEDVRPGGGETRTEVAARMVAVIGPAAADLAPGGTLVVASHGGAIRVTVGALLGLPPAYWSVLGVLSNAAWTVLTHGGGRPGRPWRLVEYNAGSLPEPALGDDR